MRKTSDLTRFVVALSLILTIELIGLPQPVTGPLINAMLLLIALLISPAAGVIAGTLTPLVALLRGQLPFVLWPMVPFIAIGNALWVTLFSAIRRSAPLPCGLSPWFGVLAAAITKALWLYAAARLLLPFVFGIHLPAQLLALMAAPQLFTALFGGAVALFLHRLLQPIINSKPV